MEMISTLLSIGSVPLTIVGIAATVLPEESRELLVRILGTVARREGRISGEWKGVYRVTKGKKTSEHHESLRVRQLGRNVIVRVPGIPKIRARGIVRQDKYVTGEWFHAKAGSVHHGAFQMIVSADGTSVSGKWVGYSQDRTAIQCETWVWTRQ